MVIDELAGRGLVELDGIARGARRLDGARELRGRHRLGGRLQRGQLRLELPVLLRQGHALRGLRLRRVAVRRQLLAAQRLPDGEVLAGLGGELLRRELRGQLGLRRLLRLLDRPLRGFELLAARVHVGA